MSEPKTRPTTVPVSEFLSLQPAPRRAECEALVAMMEAATGERACMWGAAIVGFGRYVTTNSSKKPMEWPVVAFSPRKRDLTLYLMPGFDGFADLMAKVGKHRTGSSCVYIRRLADVDPGALRALIDAAVAAMAPRRVRD